MKQYRLMRRFSRLALVALGATSSIGIANAQGTPPFPTEPLRFVSPFPPGAGSDTVARHLSKAITDETGISIIVENKPGANGFIAAGNVARAAPDGYTLFFTSVTTHAANANLFKQLPYSPEDDFTPVTLVMKTPLVFVVDSKSPYKTLPELVDALKANPGKMSYASGNSSTRAASELLRAVTNVEATHVPYKGVPGALVDLMGGHIDFMAADFTAALPLIKDGKIRPLAVTGSERSALLPDIPTARELLKEEFDMTAWAAIYAPAGTPPERVAILNTIVRNAAERPEFKNFIAQTGGVVETGSPEDLARFAKAETEKWAKIVKFAGIEPQ